MKTYRHDYTLAAEAERIIHKAFTQCPDEITKELIGHAQDLLRQYLNQDNLIECPDDDPGNLTIFASE